jgi:hypothetical protein
MRVPKLLTVFVFIVFAASFAVAGDVDTDYDHSVNFSKYRTFMWLEKPQSENPLMDDRIVNAINGHLMGKGLVPVREGADLSIRATSSTEEKETLTTYYNGFDTWGWGPGWAGWGPGWGWGWAEPGWSTTYVDTHLENKTVVDLVDAHSDKTVWRGISTGSVSDNPAKASKKVVKRIAEMFEDYPH